MPALIPNPSSVKRNMELRRVLSEMALRPMGMTTTEMRIELGLSLICVRSYVSLMLEGGAIYRHKTSVNGGKKVYRHCVAFDRDQIDGLLTKLEAQFAKPLGQQRQAIRMPTTKTTKRKNSMPMSKQKVKARNERAAAIQAESLLRRQELLVFIEKHEPVLTTRISEETQVKRTSLFKWLSEMEKQGYVVKTLQPGDDGKRSQNLWSRGENREPLKPLRGGGSVASKVRSEVSRKVVKAKQLDLERDPFIAALFGPAPTRQVAA